MKILQVLIILTTLTISSCAVSLPIESPICVPERGVLHTITVEEQRAIRSIDPDLLFRIGENDSILKGMVKTLEGFIIAHDEVLPSCE